ncbi:MAG: TonB-dependent receptor [Pseudomonadota bacterium]|nr:TonB-dependent receptor [Pseudomonadota bacterium]
MRNKHITAVTLVAGLTGLSFCGLALAQTDQSQPEQSQPDHSQPEQSESETNKMEEIVVTATKREAGIYDVPVAISAFTAETMELSGVTDLIDIGKFVPNLNVTEFSAGHTASVNPFIRGIGLQDHLITTDPGVGVYVDGVYLGRQVGQNWSLSNIERVEVLRGPQGTLYGRNSIGGAINIITRQPGDEEGGRIALEAGSRGRLNGDFYTNLKVDEHWALSVNGAYKQRGGVGDFVLLDNPRKEVGELQDNSARVAVKWTPTDQFSLLLVADANEGDNGLRPYTTLIDELPNGAVYLAGFRNSDLAADPYDNNTGQADQIGVTNEANGFALTADWFMTEALAGKLILSDRHSEYQAGLDDDSLFENFLSFPEDGEADQTSAELQVNGIYERWDFVAGLYYFKEEGSNLQDPNVFLGGAGTYFLDQNVRSKAVYGNMGFQITDQFRLAGGLRFTRDDKEAFVDINNFVFTRGERDWSETSLDLSGVYALGNGMSLYGTVQNGYQSGQFPPRAYCLFGNLAIGQPGNVTADNCFVAGDNITAQNYEVGLKGQPFNNLSMSVSAFHTQYSDLPYQVSTTSGAGFDTRNIIVDQDSNGVEWESTLLMGDSFRLHTSVGYINVDVDDPVAVAPLTPEWTASISPEYSVNLSGGSLLLRADWSYRDEMFGEPTPDPTRFTRIDSRSLLNLNVTYQPENGNWTLGAYGRNVTDERYDQGRLNTGDYVLVMLSNDASEFGLRFTQYFGK